MGRQLAKALDGDLAVREVARSSPTEAQRLRKNAANRSCGTCTLCCTVMRVDTLQKPALKQCAHLGRQGCEIYGERPVECRDFFCGWRLGFFETGERPDQLRAVVDAQIEEPVGLLIAVRESESGVFERIPKLRQLGESWFARGVPVVIRDSDDDFVDRPPRRALLPEWVKAKMRGEVEGAE